MLNKTVQAHEPRNDTYGAGAAKQANPQLPNWLDLFLPCQLVELCNDDIKKSSAKRLFQLSQQLQTIEHDFRTLPSLPAVVYLRIHRLYTLLDQLANTQRTLRSSLLDQVLERWALDLSPTGSSAYS